MFTAMNCLQQTGQVSCLSPAVRLDRERHHELTQSFPSNFLGPSECDNPLFFF